VLVNQTCFWGVRHCWWSSRFEIDVPFANQRIRVAEW